MKARYFKLLSKWWQFCSFYLLCSGFVGVPAIFRYLFWYFWVSFKQSEWQDRKANKYVLLFTVKQSTTKTKLTFSSTQTHLPYCISMVSRLLNGRIPKAIDQRLLKLIPFSTLFPGALLLYIKTSNQRNSWQKRQTNCRQVSSNFSSNLSWKSICPHLTEMLHYGETGYEVFQQIYITFDHLSQQCFFQKFIFVIFQA